MYNEKMHSNMVYLQSRLSQRELLEQLAEEAAELAHAALKCIRAEGLSDNPTPINVNDAYEKLNEEYNDVMLVAWLLDNTWVDEKLRARKLKRWVQRLIESEE